MATEKTDYTPVQGGPSPSLPGQPVFPLGFDTNFLGSNTYGGSAVPGGPPAPAGLPFPPPGAFGPGGSGAPGGLPFPPPGAFGPGGSGAPGGLPFPPPTAFGPGVPGAFGTPTNPGYGDKPPPAPYFPPGQDNIGSYSGRYWLHCGVIKV